MVPREVCVERSERSNHSRKIMLNTQKSAEVIVVKETKFLETKDRINRSLKYDRERRNDLLWQKT